MRTGILLPLIVVAVTASVGTASADKVKTAVLGLEVAGAVDTDSTSHARMISGMFRDKTKASSGNALAPNSERDLLDEKVANSCDTEALGCMTTIAKNLGAEVLIFGKISKRPKDNQKGYQLSMKALDVAGQSVKEWSDWVPLTDFLDGGLDRRVQQGFDTLTRTEAPITPVLTPTGTNGTTGVTGTQGSITVTPKKSGGFPWRPTAYVAGAVSVIAFGGLIYTGPIKTRGLQDQCHPGEMGSLGDASTYEPANGGSFGNKSAAECAKGPTYSKASWATGITAVGAGLFAVFAYYESTVSHKTESQDGPIGHRIHKKKRIAITPVLSPDGAGATVRFDW